MVLDAIEDEMRDAEKKAWESLAGYKFWMFGYHAGRWVNYNKLLLKPKPNPFKSAVQLARENLLAIPNKSGGA